MADKHPFSRSQAFLLREYTPPSQEALWRTMFLFNLYRLVLAGLLIFLFGERGSSLLLEARNVAMFRDTSIVYALTVLASLVAVRLRRPGFAVQIAQQVMMDIICVTLLSYASGDSKGLGVLLLMSLAAAGMLSRSRITLFFAATASVAILLEHAYAVLAVDADVTQFLQAGLLSIAYFAVAWLAHSLAKYAIASEKLATQRGVELASMAEANRLVIEGLPDGVLVVDDHGAIRQHNPSAERLLGQEFSRSREMTLASCAPALAEMFAAWRRDRSRQTQAIRLPNTSRMVRVRFLPVQQENFGGALLMLEDMQRIQAQAQQIKLAALGRLTANIAHEIRNPLSAISYAAELFREGVQDPAQRQLADIVMENTARLNRIVQDVMQINRRDRAQAETLLLDRELGRFAEEFCQAEHIDTAVVSVEMDEHTVEFDRGHLNQILWNLCGNALRYSQQKPGSIRLRLATVGNGRIALEVHDDGPGVPQEAEQQLFEPFFTTESSGTGLGLYVARELCEANGAMLDYVRMPQGGACFRVIFGGAGEH